MTFVQKHLGLTRPITPGRDAAVVSGQSYSQAGDAPPSGRTPEEIARWRMEIMKTPPLRGMLPVLRAWLRLCDATGAAISLGTFYRWISAGRVDSIRLGRKIFIPVPEVEGLIKLSLSGEPW